MCGEEEQVGKTEFEVRQARGLLDSTEIGVNRSEYGAQQHGGSKGKARDKPVPLAAGVVGSCEAWSDWDL